MDPVVTRGRRLVATFGSLVLGAGLAVTLAPTAGSALPAAAVDKPAPQTAASGPEAQARAHAFPARLGSAQYTGVYGSTEMTSSSKKKLTASVSASKAAKGAPFFYIALTRGGDEQHAWSFPAPSSAFDISKKAAGKLTLTSKQTGGMGKVALKVEPDGAMKSQKCGGEVYAKSRNVTIAGTFFFDSDSKWGKVGKKTKPTKFRTAHTVYFSYDVDCPPTESQCSSGLSWSTSFGNGKQYTYLGATKTGSSSSVYAYRSTELAKPEGARRHDSAWGTGSAPVLTVASDESASMKIHGVSGSGTLTDPSPGQTSSYPCKNGTQHSTYWWGGTVTNDATPVKLPAQVFGDFTVPDGTHGYMSKTWSD